MAVRLGADALGFVLFEGSARYIRPAVVVDLLRRIPAFVSRVGVFVDAGEDCVRSVLVDAPFDLLQFHGDETPDYCESFGRPYIKAVRSRSAEYVREMADRYGSARAILVDSSDANGFGGTGRTFDWELVPDMKQAVIVAGGLTPGNVASAIAATSPYAVDVSGGVEKGRGIKDPARMHAFFAAVNQVE